jgi:predicted transcriptional regulator
MNELKNRRSKWVIIADMLKVVNEEKKSTKTRIMQRAYIDWRIFKKYFEFLLEEGFIAKTNESEPETYSIAEKGIELLKRLKHVDEMMSQC